MALIALTYLLGRRLLDRPTALIAAGFVAVLPTAIYHSRMGYDCSQTPLLAFLLIAAAAWGRWWWALVAFVFFWPVVELFAPMWERRDRPFSPFGDLRIDPFRPLPRPVDMKPGGPQP